MPPQRRLHQLTPREREVLGFLRVGLTNEEIAERLEISVSGVKHHVSEILSKLGVASREEAATFAEPRGSTWRRLVGAAVVAAALAGIAVLAWSVLANDGGRDPPAISVPVDCDLVMVRDLEFGIHTLDLQTCEMTRLTDQEFDYTPVFSPDGTRVLFSRAALTDEGLAGVRDLWALSPRGGRPSQLTYTPDDHELDASWSSDGSMIAFVSWPSGGEGRPQLKVLDADDPSAVRTLLGGLCGNYEWSPRSTEIAAFGCIDGGDGAPLLVIDAVTGAVRELARDTFYSYVPRWSPDGKTIAYACELEGDPYPKSICVVNAAGGGEGVVSREGYDPVWTADGELIAYADDQGLSFVDPDNGEVERRIDEWNAFELRLTDGLGAAKRCLVHAAPCGEMTFLIDLDSGVRQDILDEGCGAGKDWTPDWAILIFSVNTKTCF